MSNKKFINRVLPVIQLYLFNLHHNFLICLISCFLLLGVGPIASLCWLCVPTIFFLYSKNYRGILIIWAFTVNVWYFIFTTTLSEIPILIGFENTNRILYYIAFNNFMFENLCFQTVYLIDTLSAKLGFSIYIPAIIKLQRF